MAKNSVTDWSETAADNTDVGGVNIAEGCAPSGINNAIRTVMSQLKSFFKANVFRLRDNTDETKLLAFDLSGLTTATTRTLTVPDASGTVVLSEKLNAPSNLSIAATVASNALTIAIKGHDGNDPSAGNPVYVPFRSVTANSGDVEVLTLSAATSFVVSSGSTLGTTSAVAATLTVVGFNDGGTFRLGIINSPTAALAEGLASSTAEGGAGAADSSGVFYTGTAVTSKAYIVLGYVTATEATAGTWATAPAAVQVGAASQPMLAALPFTKSFESAEQAITSGGSLTLTHGLGAEPKIVQALLVCKVADLGYSVGDKVLVDNHLQGNTAANGGHALVLSDTDVFVRFNNTPSTYRMNDKSSGSAASGILNTSWRLVLKAWA